jgi:benzoyl-CoA reductase/2-hydroxyglutaryl-CoA dehydratase subunit BcrC/BadD/HgdB
MSGRLRKLTLSEWDPRYQELRAAGLVERPYGGPLRRHVDDGDLRLLSLEFDGSAAALRLWNFLLTEEDRLRKHRAEGRKLVGAMKDLGTVPVIAYASDALVAFYPDGAWWIPCVMQMSEGLLQVADRLGIDESFCPVRAMLGAFLTGAHFPIPDVLTCSVGAVCDDFSAIAQRLVGMGHPVFWWEMPHRRQVEEGEIAVPLPGGVLAPAEQVAFVRSELERVREELSRVSGSPITDAMLARSIRRANRFRRVLDRLRLLAYAAEPCPMPSLELLVAEMIALHFCSDADEAVSVVEELLAETEARVDRHQGVLESGAARLFWVNPVADMRVMNLVEQCGGRICGTEYLFSHALDPIPEDVEPMEALARCALADPMVGPASERVERIVSDVQRFGAEGIVVSRIPGASHCAFEGEVLRDAMGERAGVPVVEVEVPPVSDSLMPTLRTRLDALVETVRALRQG